MKMSLDKKGSYVIEAAVVLPVIMLSVITAILIIMFFYTQMTEQCRLHEALRAEARTMTDKNVIGGEVTGKKYLVMEHSGILRRKGTFVLESHCYAIDGPSYVRASSIVRGEKDE